MMARAIQIRLPSISAGVELPKGNAIPRHALYMGWERNGLKFQWKEFGSTIVANAII